jgi:exopolysaccharide production protein ExoY
MVLALAALAILLPLMLMVALAIRLTSKGPVFFIHKRIGRNGQTFGCCKFRTMAVDADRRLADLLERDPQARAEWQSSQKLLKDPRITAVGHFLRRSSIDELPQLYNILNGTMSWVGPRPIVQNEVIAMAIISAITAGSGRASPACGRSAGAAMSAIAAVWRWMWSISGGAMLCSTV